MAMFKRLWNSQERENQQKRRASVVEEMKENQPFNPFTELLFLEQHKDIVRLMLKIDSKRCVSAADDNLAIIWDIQFGYKLVTLSGHSRPITALLYLPAKGEHRPELVTGSSDKQIRMWDIDTGDCLKVLTEHLTSVKCLLFYGRGGQFFSGGEELCLWSRSGQLLAAHKQQGEENSVSLMISLRNDRLVTSVDKQLAIYVVNLSEVGNHQDKIFSLVKRVPPHREAVKSLINIADDMFASGSIDGTIIVWKTDNLQTVRYLNSVQEYDGPQRTFPYSVQHMICLNQNYIMAAIGSGFALYDVTTGDTLIKKENAHHSKINHLTFTCGGLYLASAAVDGSIRLWSFIEVLKDAIQNDNVNGKNAINTTTEKGIRETWLTVEKHRYNLALVGECLAHSGSVQVLLDCDAESIVSCGDMCLCSQMAHCGVQHVLLDCDGESIVSCGVDSLLIVWKNENIQMMKRSHVLQTLRICDGIV